MLTKNRSNLTEMIINIEESDLPQKTMRWAFEKLILFYNGKLKTYEGDLSKNKVKLERRTILFGYFLLTILQIQQKHIGLFGDLDKFSLKLDEKTIIEKSTKTAINIDKLVKFI